MESDVIRGKNHHGEHDRSRENAETRGIRPAAAPCDDNREANKAIYDRRNAYEQFDDRLEHRSTDLGEISTTKMADPKANGKASSVESA